MNFFYKLKKNQQSIFSSVYGGYCQAIICNKSAKRPVITLKAQNR